MKDAILNKLGKILCGPALSEEATVVYLLVQIRKYLEQDNSLAAKLPTLLFYYDWVVHHGLDRTAAQSFLQAIYPRLESREGPSSAAVAVLDKFMTLGVFREELEVFLRANGLPDTLCIDQEVWINFIHTYANVVKDCKLIVKPRSLPADARFLDWLPLVVSSLAIEPLSDAIDLLADRPFPMKWTIEYRHKDDAATVARGEFRMTASGVESRKFSM